MGNGKKKGSQRKILIIVIALMIAFPVVYLILFNEPTAIQVTEETDIIFPAPPEIFEIPFEPEPPTFEPREIRMTPIVVLTDDSGNEVTTRGETTILQQFTGLDISVQGVPDVTYNDGRIRIMLEFFADKTIDSQISIVGDMDIFSPANVEVPEGTAVIQVCPPRCGEFLLRNVIINENGVTEGGFFVTEIYNDRMDSLTTQVQFDGTYLAKFVINNLAIGFDMEEFRLPTTEVQCVTTPCPPLTLPLEIYRLFYTFTGISPIIEEIIVENQTIPMNATEAPIEQVVEEDTPFVPCPDVKDDSITFLFPSVGVSGTSALWDKIIIDGKSHDIINVDIRNNRNCDITLAVGSQWQRVTGQIFKSDIEEFTVVTNGTKPFSSIPFDGTIDCNAGSCAGQEIQWCFIAKATVDEVTEIVDPFCGKKFYR